MAENVKSQERGTMTTSEYTNRKGVQRVSVQMSRSDAEAIASGDKAVLETVRNQVRLLLAS